MTQRIPIVRSGQEQPCVRTDDKVFQIEELKDSPKSEPMNLFSVHHLQPLLLRSARLDE